MEVIDIFPHSLLEIHEDLLMFGLLFVALSIKKTRRRVHVRNGLYFESLVKGAVYNI